ncbi:MAG TPA: PAS domain S-box protein, partial [Candidatus Synoicihabitans sp.]|nr:PAS domain S-box protein [Candidatus Synoicihabitans sp.]
MADPSSLLPPEDPARVQARLAGILEVALDCIVTVDHEGRFIDFNPAAERTFGYTKAEVMGRDMADLIIPPTLRARHREGMARLLTGQAPHMLGRRIEISAIRRDGTEFPIELAITRIDLGRDVPPVYAAHLRDITDRRETESALISLQTQLEDRIAARTAALRASEASLRDSQELFSKSFAASPALMSIARLPGGGLIEVNEAFLRSVGRTREEVIGKTSRELGLWVDPVQREIFLGKLLDARVVRDFEAELKNEAGERRTMLLNADLIDSANGPAVLTVAIDISERRRRELAEAALARAEASYRSIFENALEGLYQTSPNGQFIRANPALARMFGYDSPDELITSINDIGRSLYVEPGRREQFFKLLGQHDQVTDFESEVFRRDGSRLWVSESVHAVRDPHGQLLFLE